MRSDPQPSAAPTAAAGDDASPASAAVATVVNEQAHEGGDHAHGSPHGGVVVTTPGGGHLEARLEPSGRVTVWLLDDRQQPVPSQGSSGRVCLAVAGARDVPLAMDSATNALVGQVVAPATNHVVALVTVIRADGRTTTVRVPFHLESAGH